MKLFDETVDKIPYTYSIKGIQVICTVCKNDHFIKSHALLNTAGMTFLGFDWANKSAVTLTCDKCGQVLWFRDPDDLLTN